ncbi:hypothetical protein HHK36_019446 [Tetracentron sinense]|uniref:3-oxo-5-alpha-steroid 4-dehydrogenase C-terminal domain-containing protein n=1 Tax=Tetracentron sinense TaxID=13715 RepID=A0A834YXD4_TETSI|nr:hypothetical protein HHK36_019446 [Tetracentron sinense]
MIPMLLKFVFPPPSSLFITAMSVIGVASLAGTGYSETRGKHLQYSKFWNVNSQKTTRNEIKLSSRTGMLMFYTPAFLAGVAAFALFPDEGFRFFLVSSALTIHYFKRVFEVLFVHKYSGGMGLDTVILISPGYLISTATIIYTQHLTRGVQEPPLDLKYLGVVLFLVGISGNFYHHYILSKLREKGGEKGYKIPQGGLFDMVICPHYLFEILGFVGISFISQTVYAFSVTIGSIFYLLGRSYATRKWYLSKFENFPKEVKALIPYVF